MDNQVMSSASSSSPQPKNSKDRTVAVEEAKENNNNVSVGSSQEAMSETRNENPTLGSGGVQTGREITMLYPSRSNKVYTCQFCSKGFPTTQALGGHQNAHKQDREWERKRKEMEEDFPGLSYLNRYIEKPHLFLGGYSEDALSNDNHLGITIKPLKHTGHGLYPFNGGLGAMNMPFAPSMTPTRFYTGNSSTYGSPSAMGFGPRPTYHPMVPMNGPPFLPSRTNNLPSGLYPQVNRLSEEDLTLKIGRDKVVVIDDDDDDDQPEEENPKDWGNDLSL